MALRAAATTRPPLSPPPSTPNTPLRTLPVATFPSKTQFRPTSISLPISTATLSLFALFTAPHDARALALPKEDIVSSIDKVEKTIGQVQEAGSNAFDVAKQVFDIVSEKLKPGIDAAMPILQQAGEEAVKIASPAVSEASKKAQEAIRSSGFDTQPVFSAAKTVADAAQQTTTMMESAKPLASSTLETISSADPSSIAVAGGALVLAYLLLPPIFSAISYNFRGYKGDLSPAQVLDLVSSRNYLLVDIRSEKDKNKAGVPRLPSNAKNKVIAIPLEDLPSKLRGIVRNAKKLEAELVALKISYLKKVGKGSNIVIIDSYSDSAKIVARTLTSVGFKNCWIVSDGFSGRQGWLQSRLGTDSYGLSFSEIVSPSRVMGRFGTTSRAGTVKLLPGSD